MLMPNQLRRYQRNQLRQPNGRAETMTTSKQAKANKLNGEKSTGPKTPQGKAKASGNAIRHGIFSTRMLLADEDPQAFQLLLEGLQQSLRPAGSLELALVERIAISLWRQQRLVRAESAAIELGRRLDAKTNRQDVEIALGMVYPDQVHTEDLILSEHVDTESGEHYSTMVREAMRLDRPALAANDLGHLEQTAPTLYQALLWEAEEAGLSPREFARRHKGGLTGWADEVTRGCRVELGAIRRSTVIAEVAALVRSAHSAPLQQELISRYQTALDNELYRAIRALKELQEWRIKTLDNAATTVGE